MEREGVARILFANLAALVSAGLGVTAGSRGMGEMLPLLGSVTAGVIGLYVLSSLKVSSSRVCDRSYSRLWVIFSFYSWVINVHGLILF